MASSYGIVSSRSSDLAIGSVFKCVLASEELVSGASIVTSASEELESGVSIITSASESFYSATSVSSTLFIADSFSNFGFTISVLGSC